jgi:hypothetical protein
VAAFCSHFLFQLIYHFLLDTFLDVLEWFSVSFSSWMTFSSANAFQTFLASSGSGQIAFW